MSTARAAGAHGNKRAGPHAPMETSPAGTPRRCQYPPPGSVAAVIVYENRWVLSLVNTWRRHGARFIADGGISAGDVIAALDATEPS